MSNAWAVVLSVLFFIPFVSVYADNPTPYDEWDFHFTNIEIYQNPNNLKQLMIEPHVFFEGNESLGSVNLEIIVTDPDGYSTRYDARINNIEDETEKSTYLQFLSVVRMVFFRSM